METTNPLLAKLKIPGRTFQLPSCGALYNNGELATTEGEVHVHPLSGIAEITLKNPDQLFNGKAIEAVFAECIPEIRKPTEMYARDIDAVMYFLRIVTYGPEYSITVKHTCEGAKNHGYAVNIEQIVMNMKRLDPTLIESLYTVTLANGQVVRIRPIKFEHMIQLFQMNSNKKEVTPDDVKRNLIFNLMSVIESVDGITDREMIEAWVRAATTPMHNRIIETVENTNEWGPERVVTLKCKDCGELMQVELPINPISFFTE